MSSALSSRSLRSATQIATAFSLAVGLMSVALLRPALAEEQMTRTLVVSGQGSEYIPTTVTRASLGVEAQGRTAQEVQQEVARRSNAVIELLRSRNVTRLQTTGVYLSPVYDYSDERQRLVGYTATNTVSFEIANDRAGSILDDAVNAGATRIDGVSFIAADEAIATARQAALREATDDALDQADTLLSHLRLTRREIVNIQVNGAMPTPPIFMQNAQFDRAAAAAPTPIVGGEQEVQASVTLQISY